MKSIILIALLSSIAVCDKVLSDDVPTTQPAKNTQVELSVENTQVSPANDAQTTQITVDIFDKVDGFYNRAWDKLLHIVNTLGAILRF